MIIYQCVIRALINNLDWENGMSFKRAITIASAFAALALATTACGSDDQPPVGAPTTSAPTHSQSTAATTTTSSTAAVIEDTPWAQLMERASKCSKESVTVVLGKDSRISYIFVASVDVKRSIAVFPKYGEATENTKTSAIYTNPNKGAKPEVSTNQGDDSERVDMSASSTESETRTIIAQTFLKELLDERGCSS